MTTLSSPIDSRLFRNALGSFATGVTVVTTRDPGGADVGLTASSFNSVSLNPPLILWSLAKNSASLPAFLACEHFAVHVLASAQQSLSDRFSKRGTDKFADIAIKRGPSDIPLLDDCAALFVCKMVYRYEGGDHLILVGEVIGFEHYERAPLLFHSGRYGRVLPRFSTPSTASGDVGDADAELRADYLGLLLGQAALQIYQPVKDRYQTLGLSECGYYILMSLVKERSKTVEGIERLITLGGYSVSENELDALLARELVAWSSDADPQHIALTPSGVEMIIELAAVAKAAEDTAMENMDREDLALLKNILKKVITNTKHLIRQPPVPVEPEY